MRATSLTRTGPACRTFRTFRTAPRRGCDRQDRAHLSPELKSTHWTKHRGPVSTYVGQSGNIDSRVAQHVASGKVMPDEAANATRTEVLGGRTAREVAEQTRINEITSDEGARSPLVSNERNPVGPARQYLMH
jgi:hypothetical protein